MSVLTEGTKRITTSELLALVGDEGSTARTLEYWRQEGLLPKAQRTGQSGKRPEWTYPAEAADQLIALLRLRETTKQPDVLRVALWFEGFPIDLTRVRASIAADLARLLELMTKEVAKRRNRSVRTEISTWEALEQIARQWARKRGPKAPPRYGRQKLEDRERAMTLAFGLLLGVDDASERLKEDAQHIERMIGIDRGRSPRGGLPALLHGPAGEALAGFASLCSLPALIETVEKVTQDELATSRSHLPQWPRHIRTHHGLSRRLGQRHGAGRDRDTPRRSQRSRLAGGIHHYRQTIEGAKREPPSFHGRPRGQRSASRTTSTRIGSVAGRGSQAAPAPARDPSVY